MSAGMIEQLCATLAGALVGPDALVAPGLVGSWLAGHLPTRDYTTAYTPPPVPAFRARETPTDAAVKRETSTESGDARSAGTKRGAGERQIMHFDVVQHITSGETTTSDTVRADGTHLTVITDEGAETPAQHLEACHYSIPMATHLLTEHICGEAHARPHLIDTLARLFLAILLEPLRIAVDIEFSRPVTRDIAMAIEQASTTADAASSDALLDSDRLLQTHMASFVVHWFAGIAELGVAHRLLGVDALDACRTMLQNHTALFDAAQCRVDEMHIRLAGFWHNARVAARLDRGRLLGAFGCALALAFGPERSEFARDVCVAAVDRACVRALAVVRTPAGARLGTPIGVTRACESARTALRALPIAVRSGAQDTLTPVELMAQVVATIQSKY